MQPPSPIHKGRVSTPPSPSPAGKYTSPPTRPPSLVISSAAERSKEPRLRPTPRIRPPANSRGGIQTRPLSRPPTTTRHRQPSHHPFVISSAAERSKEPRLRPTPRIRPPANSRVSNPPSLPSADNDTSSPTKPPSLVISSAAEKSKASRLRPTPHPCTHLHQYTRGGFQTRPLRRPELPPPPSGPRSPSIPPRPINAPTLRVYALLPSYRRRSVSRRGGQRTNNIDSNIQISSLTIGPSAASVRIVGAGFNPALSLARRQRHVIANQATPSCHFERSREIQGAPPETGPTHSPTSKQ